MSDIYDIDITPNRSALNARIFEVLIPELKPPYLDIGCNSGYLLSKVPGGTGIDNSPILIEKALKSNLTAVQGDIEKGLPFADNEFNQSVLSCVLEQTDNPLFVLEEAIRVSRYEVVGINPIPGKSQWGTLNADNKSKWVKSIIPPQSIRRIWNGETAPINDTHYFFRIRLDPRKSENVTEGITSGHDTH